MTKPETTVAGSSGNAHLIRNLDSFTRLKQEIAGALPISGMVRLLDLVQSPEGDIHYVATGRTVNGADGSVLRKVVLKIQGCLLLPGEVPEAAWEYELDVDRVFVLVRSEAELPPLQDEPDDEDYLVADKELDLSELVEDEVLLDLPVAPFGANELGGHGHSEHDEVDGDRKENPFQALAALKKQNH